MISDDILYLTLCTVFMAVHYILWRRQLLGFHPALSATSFLPFIATVVSLAASNFEICLLPAYLGSVLYTFSFAAKSAKRFLPAMIVSAVMAVSSVIPCLTAESYREPSFLPEFNEVFTMMKRHYVLGDYKGIDWDGLYEEYSPRIKALERGDEEEFKKLCFEFGNEFPDPHVSIVPKEAAMSNAPVTAICTDLSGNDLGFCGVRLDDGRILAVNVSPDSAIYEAGLRDGSELLAFDGTEINEYVDSTKPAFMNFADEDNLDFVRPITAFGIEGTSAELTFKTEDGNTVTAEAKSGGTKSFARSRTVMRKLRAYDEDDVNMSWEALNDDTARLIFNGVNSFIAQLSKEEQDMIDEMWDANMRNPKDPPYPNPYETYIMNRTFDEMEEKGMKKLIIDVRCNGGGELELSAFLASFFTDEELFVASEQYKDFYGNTITTDPITTGDKPANRWGDKEIVILVGCDTASAAEIFTRALSPLPNVTVMGITESAGCAMAVSGSKTKNVIYQFPMLKMVDENGDILIDSGTDMQQKLPLDIKIPFDENAFEEIFIKNNDYALDYALDYLKNK